MRGRPLRAWLLDLVGGVTTYCLSHTSSSSLIKASLIGITLIVIGKFICQPGKYITRRGHLLVNFIKNRGKTALTLDFKTKLFPARFLMIGTGHKLIESHAQQTALLRASLKPMALINSKPNENRNAITRWAKAVVAQNRRMKRLLQLLQRWAGKREEPPLHTPRRVEVL